MDNIQNITTWAITFLRHNDRHSALARLQSPTPLVTRSKPSIKQTLTTVRQTMSALQTERDNIQ